VTSRRQPRDRNGPDPRRRRRPTRPDPLDRRGRTRRPGGGGRPGRRAGRPRRGRRLVAAAPALAWLHPAARRSWRSADAVGGFLERLGRHGPLLWGLAAAWFLAARALTGSVDALTGPATWQSFYVDVPWHIALTAEALDRAPTVYSWIPDVPIGYSWLFFGSLGPPRQPYRCHGRPARAGGRPRLPGGARARRPGGLHLGGEPFRGGRRRRPRPVRADPRPGVRPRRRPTAHPAVCADQPRLDQRDGARHRDAAGPAAAGHDGGRPRPTITMGVAAGAVPARLRGRRLAWRLGAAGPGSGRTSLAAGTPTPGPPAGHHLVTGPRGGGGARRDVRRDPVVGELPPRPAELPARAGHRERPAPAGLADLARRDAGDDRRDSRSSPVPCPTPAPPSPSWPAGRWGESSASRSSATPRSPSCTSSTPRGR
jgi:hypothetical protein